MVPGLIRRQIVMKCLNAHLNKLHVMFSVCVNECQDKLPVMYWLPKLHKRQYKARFLLILVLVLPLNFLNY